MSVNRDSITLRREDISRFVVHLTRDDTNDFTNGATGAENLDNIMSTRVIQAARAHCLHVKRLPDKQIPENIKESFRVACFTEVPLSQIHLLTQPINGVRYQREEYGLVFDKRALIDAGAQPAIYVNGYGGNREVLDAFDSLFEDAMESGWTKESWKVLPYVNAMHERYDFTWEREWRTCGDYSFSLRDVVALILPSTGEAALRERAAKAAIPCISPGWTYEMIVSELSKQQRKTKRLWKEIKPISKDG